MRKHLATFTLSIVTLLGFLSLEVSAAVPTAAPTNLTVFREGPYKIPISWTSVSDPSVTGYQVDMLPENDFLRRATVTGTSFTAAFMKTDVTYRITVRAKNPSGLGPGVTTTYKVPPASVTMAIPDLSIIPASTVAQVRWSPVQNATRYLIAVHDLQEYNTTPSFTRSLTSSPAFINGLLPGRVYRLTIRAIGIDNTFMETSRIFTAIPLSPPKDQPTNLVMLGTETGGVLSWNRVVNASFYRVEVGTTPTSFNVMTPITTPATTLTLTGLTQNQLYYLRVTPLNYGGKGPASDVMSWNTIQAITQPPVLTSVIPGPNRAVVSWTAAPGSTRTLLSYARLSNRIGPANCIVLDNVHDITKTVNSELLLNPTVDIRLSPVPSVTSANPTASNNQAFMFTSPYVTSFMLGWHEYGLRGYGQNNQGNGPLSVTTKTMPTGIPRTLVSFTADSTPEVGNGFKFLWPGVPDVPTAKQGSYIIYIQEVASATERGFNPRDPSTLVFPNQKSGAIIKGLKPDTDYYVDVTPVNDAGEGCYHELEPIRAKTIAAPKDAPVVKFVSGPEKITLSWNAIQNAIPNGYIVSYAPQDDFVSAPPIVKTNQTSPVTLTGLTNGQPYKISVTPMNGAGVGKETIVYAAPSVPMTHAWVATSTARISRAGHQSALLPSGDVLAIGGYTQPGSGAILNLNATDRYLRGTAPSTGSWTADSPMGLRRYGATTTTLQNGDLVVIGGHDGTKDLNSVQMYNDTTKLWTSLPSLKDGRSFHTTTLLNNGDLLVVGGVINGIPVATGERFKKGTNQWVDINPMPGEDSAPGPRSHHTATRMTNGRVLVVGGIEEQKTPTFEDPTPTSYLTTVLEYDPTTDIWLPKTGLDTPRAGHTATRLHNGKILIVGGISPLKVGPVNLYDPDNGQWSGAIAPLPTPRHGHQATLLQDGSVLITGGYVDPTPLASTFQLTYPDMLWIQRSNMPDSRTAHSATRLMTGELLIHGGQLSSGTTNTSYLYQ